MDKKRYLENTYSDALLRVVSLIRARVPSLRTRHILIVPDKYTLLAEKLLYEGTAGAFDAEVLTLNRLYFRLAQDDETETRGRPLGRTGAVLTMRRILSECGGALECMHRSAQNPTFAETVYDNLCQFMASGLTSDDLPADVPGATGCKLRDLKVLYKAYEDATRGKFIDSAGRLRLLCELLADTRLLENTHVYFACFDGYTVLQRKIIARMEQAAASVTVADAACDLVLPARVTEYTAPSAADELKAAAVRICDCVRRGMRYGDIGVVAAAPEFNRLQRIFSEYDIPFFTDRKYALSTHPLARYVITLLACAANGRNEDYVALSKNPCAGVDAAQADEFENYVFYCNLGEGGLRYAFNVPQDKKLAALCKTAESVRVALVKQVALVQKQTVTSGRALCDTVRAIVRARSKYAALLPSPIDDAAEKIEEAAEVLAEVYGAAPFSQLLDALGTAFSAVKVSAIPNRSDVVEVGEPSVFRASKKRMLLVLGFHDGELPAAIPDGGMLSDRELDELAVLGAVIEPKVAELAGRAVRELNSVLSSADALWLSHLEGRAPSLSLLKAAVGAKRESFADERRLLSGFAEPDAPRRAERERLLEALCPTPAAARELMLLGRALYAADNKGFGCEGTLQSAWRAAGGRAADYASPSDRIDVRGLYFTHGISVSRVQEYFACPLRCFLESGLKLRARPDGTLSPLDLGTFLHGVVQAFVEGGDFSDPDKTVAALVQAQLQSDDRLLRYGERFVADVTREAGTLCGVVAQQIRKGAFTVKGCEVSFGEGSDYKGPQIVMGDKSYELDGVIDRLDELDGAARIVDYKTGKIDFSAADVYYGKRMQLAVYLAAMRENGLGLAGMFYFPFRTRFVQDVSSFRLTGLYNEDYARAMDGGLRADDYESDVIKAKTQGGELTLGAGGVPAWVLHGVCDYALSLLASGAREMQSGYIAASPLCVSGEKPCTYCAVAPVCAARRGEPQPRKGGVVKPEFLAACAGSGEED